MSSKMKSSLLYSQNELFIAGEFEHPINQVEIIDNLKGTDSFSNNLLHKRLLHSILLFLIAVLFLWSIWLAVKFAYVTWVESKSMIVVFNATTFIIGSSTIVLLCFRTIFKSLLTQDKSMSRYKALLSNGNLLIGEISSFDVNKYSKSFVSYSFRLSENRIVKGIYHMSSTKFSQLKSRQVTVWYVDKDIHTLL